MSKQALSSLVGLSMRFSIVRGVVDNDHKGNTSRGTIFYMEISESKRSAANTYETTIIARYEWGLIEELAGKFDPAAVAAPYYADNKLEADETNDAIKDAKKTEKQSRVDNVKADPKLIELINRVIADHPKVLAQFRAGKDRASNALVGVIISEMKATKELECPNAAAIAILLKRCLETA